MKNKVEKIVTALLVFVLVSLTVGVLSQKNDYTEITENSYVSSMGIEYNLDDNTYTVYLYILNNLNMSITDYGTSEANKLGYICKDTGISIHDAIAKINKQSNIRLQYSHIRSVIIKDTFFNKKNTHILYNQIRLGLDIYPTFSIYTTSNDLMEVYDVKNFSDTSAYYTILVNIDGLNKPKNATYLNFANDVLLPNYTVPYPIIKVNHDNFHENDNSLTSLDISGYSFLNDDFILSSFSFDNLRGLNHLNRLSKNILSFKEFDYLVNEYSFHKKLEKGVLQISIFLRGAFVGINGDYTDKELIELLKDYIKSDMNELKETMDNYNIDVFNIDYLKNKKNSFLNTKIKLNITII